MLCTCCQPVLAARLPTRPCPPGIWESQLVSGHPVAQCAERVLLPRARRLSAEDLRGGLGAVGRKMSSAAVERLVSDLDISGCGSLDLEARPHPAA